MQSQTFTIQMLYHMQVQDSNVNTKHLLDIA